MKFIINRLSSWDDTEQPHPQAQLVEGTKDVWCIELDMAGLMELAATKWDAYHRFSGILLAKGSGRPDVAEFTISIRDDYLD